MLSQHATWISSPLCKWVTGTRTRVDAILSISASNSVWNSKMQKQKNDAFSLLTLHRPGAQPIVVEYIYLPLQSQFLWGYDRDKDSCILYWPDTQHPLCLVLWCVLPEEFSIIIPSGTNVKIFTGSTTFLPFHLNRNSTCDMIEMKMSFPRSENYVQVKVI